MRSNVLRPGEGRSVWAVGDRYTIKTSGQDSGGAFAVMEALVPPQSGPPPHRHSRESNPLSPETPVTVQAGDIEMMAAVAPKYGIEIVLPEIK